MTRVPILALLALGLVLACGDGPAGEAVPPEIERSRTDLAIQRMFTAPAPDGAVLRRVAWRPGGEDVSFLAAAGVDSLTGEEILALFLADPATGERRRLLGVDDLLGGERQAFGEAERALRERLRLSALGITDYAWRPDGARLLVPLSGDLWEHDPAAGTSRRLTATEGVEFDPGYAPDGRRIAFARDGALWVLDPESGRERRISPAGRDSVRYGVAEFIAQEELGRRHGYWWSPDGSRLAFAEVDESDVPLFALADQTDPRGGLTLQRYPRPGDANATVRVWVAPADGGTPIATDVPSGPDVYLARVTWHPDGERLVVQVLPRDQDEIRVLLVDAATGRSEPWFVEREDGDEWVGLHDDLAFLPDGDVLWTSERSGFRHVYRLAPDGSVRHPLTEGDWPVVGISAVDPEGGWVYFTAHADGVFERHVYRARLDGSTASAPERLTREPGWHDAAFDGAVRRYLDTWTGAVRPPSVAVHDASTGDRIAWLEENPAEPFARDLVEPEFRWLHPYADDPARIADSMPTALYRPADFDPDGSYPVLVYTYGGPGAQVAKDDWLTRGRGLWHQLMVDRGYLVFSCDGRGSGARGKAWEEEVHGRLGLYESEDQAACVRALWDAEPAADPERTGVWGWSYGGFLAVNALIQEDDTWSAAAAVAPVSDWRDYDTAYTERYMELPAENPERYDRAPATFAHWIEAPFFLAWGTGDDNVHPIHSVKLVNALIDAGWPVETHLYPGRGHALGDPAARTALFQALTAFFDRSLRDR